MRSGRQALRILDIRHRHELGILGSKAASSIGNESCKDMSGVQGYLAKIQLSLLQMQASGAPLPNKFAERMLLEKLEHIPQLNAYTVEYETRPEKRKNWENYLLPSPRLLVHFVIDRRRRLKPGWL